MKFLLLFLFIWAQTLSCVSQNNEGSIGWSKWEKASNVASSITASLNHQSDEIDVLPPSIVVDKRFLSQGVVPIEESSLKDMLDKKSDSEGPVNKSSDDNLYLYIYQSFKKEVPDIHDEKSNQVFERRDYLCGQIFVSFFYGSNTDSEGGIVSGRETEFILGLNEDVPIGVDGLLDNYTEQDVGASSLVAYSVGFSPFESVFTSNLFLTNYGQSLFKESDDFSQKSFDKALRVVSKTVEMKSDSKMPRKTTFELLSNTQQLKSLPDHVMTTVLWHGTRQEIAYKEQYDEEGEDFFEVRLEKKRHTLVLLINEEGYVVERIKQKH